MLGKELMDVLYKGRELPKAKGRYVDMGMSFKPEVVGLKHGMKTRRPKRKSGELMVIVYDELTRKWESARDLHPRIDAAIESIRNSLVKLHEKGDVECNNIPGMLQYRRKQ